MIKIKIIIVIIISSVTLSCLNKKSNAETINKIEKKALPIEVTNIESGKKDSIQRQTISKNYGFLILKDNAEKDTKVIIYNKDGSEWRSVTINDSFDVSPEFSPYYLKAENSDLIFKCIKEDNNYYSIVVNEEKNTVKYIKTSDIKFQYQTIEEHIITVFSVGFNPESNPLHNNANDMSKKDDYDVNQFYYPVKIKGNWLMVRDDNDLNHWIKWKDSEGNLIIELFYDA